VVNSFLKGFGKRLIVSHVCCLSTLVSRRKKCNIFQNNRALVFFNKYWERIA